jgi:cell pole-organizing protein PopZ
LTDALRAATAATDLDSKSAAGATNGASPSNSSLSSLRSPARPEPLPIITVKPVQSVAEVVPVAQVPAPFASLASAVPLNQQSEPPIARQMASFSDRRFSSLCMTPTPVPPVPELAATPEIVVPPPHVEQTVSVVLAPAIVAAAPMAPSPDRADTKSAGSAGVDDQTAELLRPMLRQWLTENMPRMVEKALFMEVANTPNPPKKD